MGRNLQKGDPLKLNMNSSLDLFYLIFFLQLSKTKLVLEGDDKDAFSVEPEVTLSDSIVQLLVKQPQKLDYEEKQQTVLQVSKARNW